MTENHTKENDFYIRLRSKIRKWVAGKEGSSHEWAEFILLAPDLFHLIWKLSVDPEVPKSERLKLAAAVTYFISPIDLIPEAIVGPVGYLDDIALTCYVLNGLFNRTDPAIALKYWAGDDDVLLVIKKVLAAADKMVGSGILKKLTNRFN